MKISMGMKYFVCQIDCSDRCNDKIKDHANYFQTENSRQKDAGNNRDKKQAHQQHLWVIDLAERGHRMGINEVANISGGII